MPHKSIDHIGLYWASRSVILMNLLVAGGCSTSLFQWVDYSAADEFMRQGYAYLDQGLTDSALASFGLALEADPKLLEAHMSMGSVFRHHGNYELAGRCYERAVSLDPNDFDARYSLGWMQHLQGKLKEAVSNYLHAILIDPDSFDANLNLAGAYLQLGQPTDALPYAQRATELRSGSQAAWSNLATIFSLLGQYEEAVGAYHEAIELGEMAEPILLGLANAHLRLHRYEQAVVALQSLVTTHPSTLVHQRIGYAYFKMRQFPKALDHFRAALEIDNHDPLALNGAGVCLMAMYLENGRDNPSHREEALDAWRQSLKLRESQPHIADLLSRYERL